MLKLERVSFSVDEEKDGRTAKKDIVRDVTLKVNAGEILVITGPNGGGKSTLAKIIMGIQPVKNGKITFCGEDITSLGVTERAKRGIGFAFQQPVRFKGLFVGDMLRLAAGKALGTEEACKFLSEVGLCAADYIDREINASLSGGELKRIEIASLLARGVKLSVFDEPEAGIDLWSFKNLIACFENLRSKGGAVIIISHQERILDIADKIAVLDAGAIISEGAKHKVLKKIADYREECGLLK
jgi:Fe-S cluster assembly ATP-binding protein